MRIWSGRLLSESTAIRLSGMETGFLVAETADFVDRSDEGAWEAERGDRILWSMIQTGLSKTEGEKGVLSDAHLQVKRFVAVVASRLHRLHELEKKRLDVLAAQVTALAKNLIVSDQATTVSCPR